MHSSAVPRTDVPPILSMTAPSTRPAQVSNTRTLLPAWMFARVNIWASVSYRRWLHHTKKHTHHLFLLHKNTTFTDILLNRRAASPDLPRFPAVVHHSEDATGRSYNRHSIFIPGAAQDGKRPITLITARSIIFLSLQRDGGRIIRSDSLLLFLLDVLILGVFRLIFER